MWMQIGAANGGNGEAKTLRREAVDGSQAAAAVVAMARAESRREPVRCRCAGARRPEVRTRNWDRADRLSRWAVNEPNSSEPGLNFELGSSKLSSLLQLQPPAAVYIWYKKICEIFLQNKSNTSKENCRQQGCTFQIMHQFKTISWPSACNKPVLHHLLGFGIGIIRGFPAPDSQILI